MTAGASVAGNPTVSVIIPTRDRWTWLARALRAALDQRDVDVHVIVVDDGSTDETPARLRQLRDPRVQIVRHQRSEGVARARNRAVAEARGTWVAFLDDDDMWAPHKLRAQLDVAEADGADFVYASGVIVDERGLVVGRQPAPDSRSLARQLLELNVIGGPSSVMARTASVRALGGFDESLSILADWDLWLRLAERHRAARCPEVLVAIMHHSENMQVVRAGEEKGELAHLARKHAAACAAHRVAFGSGFSGLDYARWIAGQHRSAGRRLAAAKAYLRTSIQYGSPRDALRAAASLFGERATRRRRRRHSMHHGDPPAWVHQLMLGDDDGPVPLQHMSARRAR